MEKLYTVSKNKTGADCGSDHELLIAKFRLKLKKVGKTTKNSNTEAEISHCALLSPPSPWAGTFSVVTLAPVPHDAMFNGSVFGQRISPPGLRTNSLYRQPLLAPWLRTDPPCMLVTASSSWVAYVPVIYSQDIHIAE